MQFISKTVLKKFINEEISSIGFDENYIDYAKFKHLFLSIKIFDITPIQATIIKQTSLSKGCDCAINKGVLDNSIEKTDCLLSGTINQLYSVASSLKKQQFSLSKLSEVILKQIEINLKDNSKAKIMGILNMTPDSFSDGGEFLEIDRALNHAVDMIEQGAHIIDIGAQSTRPGADLTTVMYEVEKICPIIIALKKCHPSILISVDTINLACVKASLEAGADIINDVSFLNNLEFVKLCKEYNKKLVIMHSKGNPQTMDKMCDYNNLIDDIYKELYIKTNLALDNGLDENLIIVDPGFGFAKNIGQNFELLKRISEFKSLGYPILAGVSRKRFLQDVINTKEPLDADLQTALANSYLINQGIEYIRTHDVKNAIEALKFNQRLEI